MTVDELIQLINQMGDVIINHEAELTELDASIGDGDHGLNMSKGFKAVKEKLANSASLKTPMDVFKIVGMTLVSTVGGASGPLYGTAFMQMAMVSKGKETLTIEDVIPILEAAQAGIQKRGHAEAEEKTMLDMLIPYIQTLKSVGFADMPALKAQLETTIEDARQHIIALQATKGRASYLGERSVDHMDPGAQSMGYLLEELTKVM